jgi:hypothetical protein
VSLVFIPQRKNVYLRFGHPIQQRHLNRPYRSVYFGPGQVFCRIWWEGNAYGTTRFELAILQAQGPLQIVQKVYGIAPGASILLRVAGDGQVRRVLRLIDVVRAQQIDPASVSPRFWRVVQNRLATRGEPPVYTPARHVAKVWRDTIA